VHAYADLIQATASYSSNANVRILLDWEDSCMSHDVMLHRANIQRISNRKLVQLCACETGQ
jgi:hypothetical protein